jgi:uncharacterized protein (TIGR02466 family)
LKVQQAFATPLYSFQIKEAASLNEALIRDIAALRAASPGMVKSNRNGWHSEADLFSRSEESFKALCNALRSAVGEATRHAAPHADLGKLRTTAHGWINVNPKGAYNAPHEHGGNTWSGVYFVKTTRDPAQNSGLLDFLDPRTGTTVPEYSSLQLFPKKISIRPVPGAIFIFPAYLMHWVHPNEEDEDRISIAFNVRFEAAT